MTTSKVDAAAQTMINNLPEKTGKSLEQWTGILKKSGLEKHGEILTLLKTTHGVTHGFANLISAKYREQLAGGADDSQTLVDKQYGGAKAGLRPIYEAVTKMVRAFGKDVELAPKKQYVSLRRNKQFGLIQPSTKDRVDVGINLKGVAPTERLEASGSFNAMVSHRVRLASAKQVDAELKKWLKRAYDEA